MKPRDGPSPAVRKFIQEKGSEQIEDIYIARQPVQSGIQKFLNILSLGKFNKTKKDLKYDDVYHNYLIIKTKDGKEYRLEKNEVVKVSDYKKNDDEKRKIPLDKNLTIEEMINKASNNDKKFWNYDPKDNNCQYFAKDILVDNGLVDNVDKETKEIIQPQDGVKLIDSFGKLKNVPKSITDLAGGADRLIHGNGLKKGKGVSVNQLFNFVNGKK